MKIFKELKEGGFIPSGFSLLKPDRRFVFYLFFRMKLFPRNKLTNWIEQLSIWRRIRKFTRLFESSYLSGHRVWNLYINVNAIRIKRGAIVMRPKVRFRSYLQAV